MKPRSFHRRNRRRSSICTRRWRGWPRSIRAKPEVVELKYFGGLNYDEIAEVLKISAVTVRRDWEFARTWLYSELHFAE